jgi:hypothetical protein
MLTISEPNTLPTATPKASCLIAAKMDTRSSGSEVEKATKMKPMVVLPNPVMSATLTELLIATSLALAYTANAPNSTSKLPHNPSTSSNKASSHLRNYFNATLKTFCCNSELLHSARGSLSYLFFVYLFGSGFFFFCLLGIPLPLLSFLVVLITRLQLI